MRHIERAVTASQSRVASRFAPSAFDLDLSAFEPSRVIAETQDIRETGRPSIMQPRKVLLPASRPARRDDGLSKRAAQLQAERAAERSALVRPAQKQALRPTQVKSARTDHLHAEHSAQPRKERSRETCKERPEPVKKGRGSGRSFVPWCTRRS